MVSVPSDLRQCPRVPTSHRVKVVSEDRIIAYPSAINLSLSGILVGGPERLPVDSPCGVAILLESAEAGKRIVTRGRVVRADSTGMAIAFTRDLEPASLEALKALIRSLQAETDLALDPCDQPCP